MALLHRRRGLGPSPPPPASDAVRDPRPARCCVRCGYDLTGSSADGRCPECGLPCAASTDRYTLSSADPCWVARGVRNGLALLALALVAIISSALLLFAVLLGEVNLRYSFDLPVTAALAWILTLTFRAGRRRGLCWCAARVPARSGPARRACTATRQPRRDGPGLGHCLRTAAVLLPGGSPRDSHRGRRADRAQPPKFAPREPARSRRVHSPFAEGQRCPTAAGRSLLDRYGVARAQLRRICRLVRIRLDHPSRHALGCQHFLVCGAEPTRFRLSLYLYVRLLLQVWRCVRGACQAGGPRCG